MSRYSYAGPFRNPTEDWKVIPNPQGEGYVWGIPITDKEIVDFIRDERYQEAKELQELKDSTGGYRLHTKNQVFEEEEEAIESLEALEEFFEEDYDQYLEENHHEIVQMERYEQWRNEY